MLSGLLDAPYVVPVGGDVGRDVIRGVRRGVGRAVGRGRCGNRESNPG